MTEEEQDLDAATKHMLESITMFEQILEVMPDDEMALRALYDAYCHLGEREKAFEMLNRLAEMALDVEEYHLGEFLIDQYLLYEDLANDRSFGLSERLSMRLLDLGKEGVSDKIADAAPEPLVVGPEDRKDAALALAWDLFQDAVLLQDDYSMVVQDINEMSSKSTEVPVTVLHVLSDRRYSHFSAVVSTMAKKSGSPFISLSRFDVSDDLLATLPLAFVQTNAAICFKNIGHETLVAVLNPFDDKLKLTVESMLGRKVHLYLISPEEYDEFLIKIRELQTGGEERNV